MRRNVVAFLSRRKHIEGRMQGWDPNLYARFEAERNRPSVDLICRIPDKERRRVVDLGCGNGGSTEALARRYREAEIEGVDTSREMLAAARLRLPNLTFREADAASWRDPWADLVFANALFQWVPGHLGVLARLAGDLPGGGCLAVQMPDNSAEPTHVLMREIAAEPAFRVKLGAVAATRDDIGSFADYDDALSPVCDLIDIWRTTYVHRLESPEAIVAWVEGTGLRPYLAPLSPEERAQFRQRYLQAIAGAYPRRAWGGVLLPFPRLFIVAKRTEVVKSS
jgi:trans-aconitate 2-methyltransferase